MVLADCPPRRYLFNVDHRVRISFVKVMWSGESVLNPSENLENAIQATDVIKVP